MQKSPVAFFSLDRHVTNLRTELIAAIEQVLLSQQFVGGQFVQQFEKDLATYLDSKNVISNNSGTDALWMALDALDIKKDDIVLTTPFSFIASSSEIAMHEAHPVFIDVNPTTFNICPVKMRSWLEANTIMRDGKAIERATGFPVVGMVVVDLFGQTADYPAISQIAKEWNLWIVEDCAQGLGAQYQNKKAGTFGDIGTFSFYPTKNLGAFGDAGACCTNNPVLAEKLLQLRNHGRFSHYEYRGLGINSRLDGIQAALLSVKLNHLDTYNARRREIAQRYNQAFANISWLQLPKQETGTHIYHQYSVIIDSKKTGIDRDACEKYLTERGIGTRIFYPQALCDIAFLQTHPALRTDCSIAQELTRNILALPVWPELTDAEVDQVIATVLDMAQTMTVRHESQAAVNKVA